MGGICSGVEQGQRPSEEVAVTVKRKEIGNVVASITLKLTHRFVPLPPRPRHRRRGWRHSGRYIRAGSALGLIECQKGCFTKPRYANRRLRYLRFLSLFSQTTTMQHADLDMEHCMYYFLSMSPPLIFETERSPYTPSIPPVSSIKTLKPFACLPRIIQMEHPQNARRHSKPPRGRHSLLSR